MVSTGDLAGRDTGGSDIFLSVSFGLLLTFGTLFMFYILKNKMKSTKMGKGTIKTESKLKQRHELYFN